MVKDMLKDLKRLKADTKLKTIKLEGLKKELAYRNKGCGFTPEETIEGMVLKSQVISETPKSINNAFHSSTEDAALSYENELRAKNDFNLDSLKDEIRSLDSVIGKQEHQICIITALIESLNYKEKYVIDCIYNQGMDDTDAIKSFALKFGYGSRTTIMRIEENAVNKMQEIYDKNSHGTKMIQI